MENYHLASIISNIFKNGELYTQKNCINTICKSIFGSNMKKIDKKKKYATNYNIGFGQENDPLFS